MLGGSTIGKLRETESSMSREQMRVRFPQLLRCYPTQSKLPCSEMWRSSMPKETCSSSAGSTGLDAIL